MKSMMHLGWAALLVASACGGKGGSPATGSTGTPMAKDKPAAAAQDPNTVFKDLDVGADYKSWKKINTETFLSKPHGKRFVDIHVNDVGYDAYIKKDDLPVGTIIVKPSWEAKDGKASDVEGPVFVMEKKPAGFDADHGDWWYGFYWKQPTGAWKDKGGIYWRSPSPKVNYCWECHDDYSGEVGRPPREYRVKAPE